MSYMSSSSSSKLKLTRHFTKEFVVLTRYLLPLCVGAIIFGNHYIRDSVGALEKQLEDDPINLTPQVLH